MCCLTCVFSQKSIEKKSKPGDPTHRYSQPCSAALGNHQYKPFALVFPGKEARLSVLADPFLPEQLLQTQISRSSSLFWPGLRHCRVLGRDQIKVLVPHCPGKGCSSVLTKINLLNSSGKMFGAAGVEWLFPQFLSQGIFPDLHTEQDIYLFSNLKFNVKGLTSPINLEDALLTVQTLNINVTGLFAFAPVELC